MECKRYLHHLVTKTALQSEVTKYELKLINEVVSENKTFFGAHVEKTFLLASLAFSVTILYPQKDPVFFSR